jgi:hypothetical protein
MYGALDNEGNRVGNPIKSSLIGKYAGLPNIEKRCTDNREYLRDLDRRKVLAGRIRKVVGECVRRGDTSPSEMERRLSEAGISAVFRYNDDGRLTGATFIDHRGKNVYNGSNLGKDLSANAWWALFSEAGQQTRQQQRPSAGAALPRPGTAAFEPATAQSQQRVETSAADTEISPVPTAPEPATEYGDNHAEYDIFRGLYRHGDAYEQTDPEFRSLYKRRKKTINKKR